MVITPKGPGRESRRAVGISSPLKHCRAGHWTLASEANPSRGLCSGTSSGRICKDGCSLEMVCSGSTVSKKKGGVDINLLLLG